METNNAHAGRLIVLGILVLITGCSRTAPKSDDGSTASKLPVHATAPPPMRRVTNRAGDTKGSVFVVEYHHIKAGKGFMFRTPEDFRADLQHYYDLGFRPVLASEYLGNKMKLPPGASPIVLTFDDSMPSQLQLGFDGNPTPDCAIGIWQDFAKTHPDFPVHGTFFVLPNTMWGHGDIDERKAKLVLSLGCELANHTMTHHPLNRLTDTKVKWELGTATEKLEEMGQPAPHSLALPYGISPKHRALLKGFDWNGRHIQFTGVFLVGSNPAPSPESKKFNPLRVPRIIAYPGFMGTDYWLKRVKEGEVQPYVQP